MQHDDGTTAAALTRRMAAECLGMRVGRLQRLVVREFEQRLRPTGLSLPQLEMLSTLTMYAGPVRPTTLAGLLGVERSTMSRNLAVLQERGWIAPTDVSASGRSLTVSITEDGTAVLAAADEAWTQAQAALVGRLGAQAPGILDTWLTAMQI